MQEEQNYVKCLREFNEESKRNLAETKTAIVNLREQIKELKFQLINQSKEKEELKAAVTLQRKNLEVLKKKHA